MDDLVKTLAQKLNISEDMARTAAVTVIDWLKAKLPAPIAGQLDGVLSGQTSGMGDAAKGIGDSLGGLFGKK